MKLHQILLAVLLALVGQASAIVLSFVPAPGGATVIDFTNPSPESGVSWDQSKVFSNTNLPTAAQPLPGGSGNFLASNAIGNTSDSTTILFGLDVDYVGFLWGSPDTYNTIEFFKGAVSQGSFTGASVPPSNGDQNASPFVSFTGGIFDRAVLSSSSFNFEIDQLTFTRPVGTPVDNNVPDGGSTLMLLGSVMGLVGLVKKKVAPIAGLR